LAQNEKTPGAAGTWGLPRWLPIWTTNLRDRIAAGDIQGPTLLVSDAG